MRILTCKSVFMCAHAYLYNNINIFCIQLIWSSYISHFITKVSQEISFQLKRNKEREGEFIFSFTPFLFLHNYCPPFCLESILQRLIILVTLEDLWNKLAQFTNNWNVSLALSKSSERNCSKVSISLHQSLSPSLSLPPNILRWIPTNGSTIRYLLFKWRWQLTIFNSPEKRARKTNV